METLEEIIKQKSTTAEQAALKWTLSTEDLLFIAKNIQGAKQSLYVAVQLCNLRSQGQFLKQPIQLTQATQDYLILQLNLDNIDYPISVGKNTQNLYHKIILSYTGYSHFDKVAENNLKQWILEKSNQDLLVLSDLKKIAMQWLHSNLILPPTDDTLSQLLVSYKKESSAKIYETICKHITEQQKTEILALLNTDGQLISQLNVYKRSPPEPTADILNKFIDRFNILDNIGIPSILIGAIRPSVITQLADLAKRYDAHSLKKITSSNKKLALITCFLLEASKTLLDHIVEMNDNVLSKKERISKNAFNTHFKQLRKKMKYSIRTIISTVKAMLQHAHPEKTTLLDFQNSIAKTEIEEATKHCEEFSDYEAKGFYKILERKYNDLRKYMPAFFALDLEGGEGTTNLMKSIKILRQLNDGTLRTLPADAPVDFIPASWFQAMQKDGCVTRRTWEMALYYAVKANLRSGDIYLKHSRHHRYFWETVYQQSNWEKEKNKAYNELHLPTQFDDILHMLTNQFEEAVQSAKQNLDKNSFAYINQHKELKLRKEDALFIPDPTKKLRQEIEKALPITRIEKILSDVDQMVNFSSLFVPPDGFVPKYSLNKSLLYATQIAHGTNVGLVGMSHSTVGMSLEMLRHLSQWYIRPSTIQTANARLVNFHRQHPLSKIYGDGSRTGSDGDRFAIQKSSNMASFYPRYYGYYDQAITVYTHLSDQFSVFSTNVISCGIREATYVLDGLLNNITQLEPQFHSTDTGGFTHHLFALCYLLGFSFQPRLKDLPNQKLYKIDKNKHYGDIDVIFSSAVDIALIQEQWEQIVRVVASLKNHIAPAHVILQKLSSRGRSDKVSKALGEFGKLIKTIYILQYISTPELRRKIHKQLNRGESRHQLAKHLFFANQGEFKTNDYEEMMNIASCLSFLSNTVLLWNTSRIYSILNQLKAKKYPVNDEDVARISPLMFKHVIAHGMYNFKMVN